MIVTSPTREGKSLDDWEETNLLPNLLNLLLVVSRKFSPTHPIFPRYN